MSIDSNLIGHWPLKTDAHDVSGAGLHGESHGVTFASERAIFDGRGARIEIPQSPKLNLGTDDFTFAASIDTDANMTDVIGDIASKYDPSSRTGFTFSVLDFPGSVYSTPNARTLSFGIDADRIEEEWTDRGRPGNALHVFALGVYDGNLYAGTFEGGADETGHVWRYDGNGGWTDYGSPDGSNTVMSLCVHDGDLYCGTGCYKAAGSALSDAGNNRPGGRVFRFHTDGVWEDCGRIAPEAAEAHSLTSYAGKLYAIPSYTRGVYRYDGDAQWTHVGTPGDHRCMTLSVYNGDLFAGGNEWTGVWKYSGGTEWESVGTQVGPESGTEQYPVESQIYSFMVYKDALHIGTWPSGAVYRWDGGTKWTYCGRLGAEQEVMGTAVCNGAFYAGTLPLAQVYRYDGGTTWSLTGRVDHTPDVKYRRAWSMAVYNGRLWCGTLPSGSIWSYRPGTSATYDKWLTPGRHHIAAVKEASRLLIYVDGVPVAQSDSFDPTHYRLDNTSPFVIGNGPRSSFNGRISDVRLYRRALAQNEIASLTA